MSKRIQILQGVRVSHARKLSIFLLSQTIAWFVAIPMLGAGCTAPRPATNSEVLVVKDVNGKTHRPLAEQGARATLFFFVLHDCPAANAYAPEMNRIAAKYGGQGVRTYLVYVENDLDEAEARTHAREHNLAFPAVIDRHLQLVKIAGATISPEAALLSPEKQVLYLGRIDDRFVAPGQRRIQPTTHDLRDALDAVLAQKPVPAPLTKAIGCYLPGIESNQHAQ